MLPARKRRHYGLAIILLAAFMFLPFIGLSPLDDPTEVREAAIVEAMLQTGQWVHPPIDGVETTSQPLLFHWLAAASSVPWGHPTAFALRWPAALAGILLAGMVFQFFSFRGKIETAFATALCMLTTVALHRAAITSSADIVVAYCMTGATMELYRWHENPYGYWPVKAVLWLSGAVLLGGWTGLVVPPIVMFAYLWLRGCGRLAMLCRIIIACLCALILSAIWYYFTGEQCCDFAPYVAQKENGLLLVGLLPYTLVLVAGLCVVGRKAWCAPQPWKATWWQRFWKTIKALSNFELFAWVSIIVMLVCSLMLRGGRNGIVLAFYPFAAWKIAQLIDWLQTHHRNTLQGVAHLLTAVITIGVVGFMAVEQDWMSEGLMRAIGLENLITADADAQMLMSWPFFVCVVVAIYAYYALTCFPRATQQLLYNAVLIFLLTDAVALGHWL